MTYDEALKSARETLTFCLPNDLDRVDEVIAALVTPPAAAQRPWVGLTDEERRHIVMTSDTPSCVLMNAEAKLKEKNT
jgi:hypothetical protein